VDESGLLKPGGLMEFMSSETKKVFDKQYHNLARNKDNKFIFLEKPIRCKVKFINYTKSGLLRIPSFVEYIS
jgi:DNA ligase-1